MVRGGLYLRHDNAVATVPLSATQPARRGSNGNAAIERKARASGGRSRHHGESGAGVDAVEKALGIAVTERTTMNYGKIHFEDPNRSAVREMFGDEHERQVHGEERVLDFIHYVRRVMDERGIKQADLARTLGANPGQVSRWLSAKAGIRAATAFVLADALGYRLEMTWRPICNGWAVGSVEPLEQVRVQSSPPKTQQVVELVEAA